MIWIYFSAWAIFSCILIYGLCKATAHPTPDTAFIEKQNELMRLALERNNHEK